MCTIQSDTHHLCIHTSLAIQCVFLIFYTGTGKRIAIGRKKERNKQQQQQQEKRDERKKKLDNDVNDDKEISVNGYERQKYSVYDLIVACLQC